MLSAMFLQLINYTAALFEQPLSGAVHPGHSQLVFLLTGVGVLMPHAWLDIPCMEYRFLEGKGSQRDRNPVPGGPGGLPVLMSNPS